MKLNEYSIIVIADSKEEALRLVQQGIHIRVEKGKLI